MKKSFFSSSKNPKSWVDLEADARSHFNRNILICGVLFSLLLGGITLLQPKYLLRLQAIVYDLQINTIDTGEPSPIPLIVDIDDSSLAKYGQWPWPRYRIALLLAKIQAWGATSVSLDMVFPEQDRTSLSVIKESIESELQIPFSIEGIAESLLDNDVILANVLKNGRFILGNFLHHSPDSGLKNCSERPTNIAIISTGDVNRENFRSEIFDAQSAVCNIPILSKAAIGSGFFNSRPDVDGIYRKTPLLMSYQGKVIPSLALETILVSSGREQTMVEQTADGFTVRLPTTDVPLDRTGNLFLKFRGPSHTFQYVSATSVLDNSVDPSTFSNRIVLVGSSAAGINDIRSTPLDPVMPGVELHATVVDNILQSDYLVQPEWAYIFEAMLATVTGILCTAVMLWLSPIIGASVAVLSGLALFAGSHFLFLQFGLIVSSVPALISMVLALIFLSLVNYWRTKILHSRRTTQYQISQEATINGFGELAEYRDPETGYHIKRTQQYVLLLAKKLSSKEIYCDFLSEAVIDVLYKAAPMHDIGKISVPDTILLKPGKLTGEEFELMKLHTVNGAAVLRNIEEKIGSTPFLQIAKEIANFHQEKWDGSGYPNALPGEDIPIPARIMALADVYDALTSRRPYKECFSHEKSKAIIIEGQGSHFAPEIVDAFLEIEDDFLKIALEYAESDDQREILLNGSSS